MIRRLYVHNFRCLENFELPLANVSTALLIGKNGAGKTTVGMVLEILQKIARGTSRVSDLVRPKDLTRQRADIPMRFEIEVLIQEKIYNYAIAFEFPRKFKELRVLEERLSVDGNPVFSREIAQVRLARFDSASQASFRIDWHLIALSIVQEQSFDDPLFVFKQWLGKILVLRPTPSLMRSEGDADVDTIQPNGQVTNLIGWFSGLIATAPAAYAKIDDYLKQVMADFLDVKRPIFGREFQTLTVQFKNQSETLTLPFEELSDGEKCFMVFALAIAANDAYGPLLCFWDEPDNFLAPSEVGPSVMALRRAFRETGQLIVTSHNPEAIRRFSDDNTLVLFRNSHLEPTIVRSLEDIRAAGDFQGSLVDALLRGDVDA